MIFYLYIKCVLISIFYRFMPNDIILSIFFCPRRHLYFAYASIICYFTLDRISFRCDICYSRFCYLWCLIGWDLYPFLYIKLTSCTTVCINMSDIATCLIIMITCLYCTFRFIRSVPVVRYRCTMPH